MSYTFLRPTAFFQNGYDAGHADAEITADMDPYDMELYDEARKIFVERLREHGLIVPPELTPAAPVTADVRWCVSCIVVGYFGRYDVRVLVAVGLIGCFVLCWDAARRRGSIGRCGGICRWTTRGVMPPM